MFHWSPRGYTCADVGHLDVLVAHDDVVGARDSLQQWNLPVEVGAADQGAQQHLSLRSGSLVGECGKQQQHYH